MPLPEEARNRTDEALRAVARADANDLLNRDLDVLIEEFVVPFGRATLRWDGVTMTEPASANVPMQDGFGRQISRPMATSTFKVPVVGDALLPTYRSHSGAPMGGGLPGTVRDDVIEFAWIGELDASPDSLRAWLEQRRKIVEAFLANNNGDVEPLNRRMRDDVRAAIERRRRAELDRRNLGARLPFPVERSAHATRPVAVQRKQVRLQRTAPAPVFTPEPALDDEQYEDILGDCISMATVFERTPSIERMEEEAIRNLFLGMLNTNYTSRVAGELFNGVGKTDICIRAEDRNVFIGECKFYDGPKTVANAIDQLLSYLVWRDTKAALLLFVRGSNFTQAVERAVAAVRSHPQCQRQVRAAEPGRRSDYVFTRVDDLDRAIRLALLPFALRPPKATP